MISIHILYFRQFITDLCRLEYCLSRQPSLLWYSSICFCSRNLFGLQKSVRQYIIFLLYKSSNFCTRNNLHWYLKVAMQQKAQKIFIRTIFCNMKAKRERGMQFYENVWKEFPEWLYYEQFLKRGYSDLDLFWRGNFLRSLASLSLLLIFWFLNSISISHQLSSFVQFCSVLWTICPPAA